MNRELQHQDNIKRFLAEGRTVSGGDGNGPGKPGYKVITLSADDAQSTNWLNSAADEGYRVEFAGTVGNELRVILANYKKD